jgi:xanthine dehydrogenase accessory factor
VKRETPVAIVKGAGDLGSGVAWRLFRIGFRVICIDIPKPTVIRRSVAFGSALYDGRITVDGVQCERIQVADEAFYLWSRNTLPVLADPDAHIVELLHPEVLVDAVMAKHNTGTRKDMAACVIALGPGFTAGVDCHAVIETQRGHDLGRVIWQGCAAANTGVPGLIGGADTQRVIRAPIAGILYGRRAIGDMLKAGDQIAMVDRTPIIATIDGILRGMLHDTLPVTAGMKIADIDPRGELRHCYSISDKALAIAGGVLEATLTMRT